MLCVALGVVLLSGSADAHAQVAPDPGADAPPQTLVTVLGTTATLPPSEATSVSFPVAVADGVVPTDLGVSVVRLRQGSTELALDSTVAARWVPALPTVALDVTGGGLARAAVYEVLVAVTHVQGTQQLVTFTVTRPDGRLDLPSTVALTRTQGMTLLGRQLAGSYSTGPRRITALVGPDTRLTELRTRQQEAEDPTVVVTVPPDVLPAGPGTALDLPIEVTGTDPGEVTRTVELRSPQLSQDVTATFTVVTRRHPALLGVALFAGAVLGTLVRILLPRWRTSVAANGARADLLGQLDGLLARSGDKPFQDTVRGIRSQLVAASGATAVTAAVGQAKTDAEAAAKDLDGRLRTCDTEAAALRSAVQSRPHLPADLTPSLERIRAALDGVQQLLERRDATGATAQLRTARAETERLMDTARTWVDDSRTAVDAMVSVLAEPTGSAAVILRSRLQSVLRLLTLPDPPAGSDAGSARADAAQPSAASVGALLDALDRTGGYVRDNLLGPVRQLAGELRDAARLLPATDRSSPTLRRAADELESTASTAPADLRIRLQDLADTLTDLRPALSDAMTDGLPDDQREPVAAAVARWDFEAAARLRLKATTATRLRAGAGTPTDVAVAAGPEKQAPEAAAALPHVPLIFDAAIRTLPTRTALGIAAGGLVVLHAVLALALALLTGYGLFLPDWRGTYADLLQAFSWAFAVDLTIVGLGALITVGKDGAASKPAAVL